MFIVDCKKDLINASGYKVWLRVEDVLYSHPAISEAAVSGIPDDYRAESVKAVALAPSRRSSRSSPSRSPTTRLWLWSGGMGRAPTGK